MSNRMSFLGGRPLFLGWLLAATALLCIPARSASAQDAFEVPAFASANTRLVLRPGDLVRLGRVDGCARPADQDDAQVDAVYADSIVLRTIAGRLVLRAGAGDALATDYRPMGGVPEPPASRQAATVVTGVILGATGAFIGAIGGLLSSIFTLMLFPPEPFAIAGAIIGTLSGFAIAADINRAHEAAATRLPNSWGQLELRRDVRAAACEFRPAP